MDGKHLNLQSNMTTKTCPICNIIFHMKHGNEKFCSPKCLDVNKNKISKRYNNSQNGKLSRKRYSKSKKGKIVRKKYNQSDNGKAVIKAIMKKYNQSDNGKAIIKEYQRGPIVKERKKEYEKRPEVKARRMACRNKPEIKTRDRERQKKYNQIDKVKIRKKRYLKKWLEENHDKKKMYQKEICIKYKMGIYINQKKNICVICGKPAPIKYCSKKCMGIGISGNNNPVWNGGPNPYSNNWNEKFKKSIRERDSNICHLCLQKRRDRELDVHHIDGNPKNTSKSNCISLHKSCHQKVEKQVELDGRRYVYKELKYTYWMPLFRKILSESFGYKYPNKSGIEDNGLL